MAKRNKFKLVTHIKDGADPQKKYTNTSEQGYMEMTLMFVVIQKSFLQKAKLSAK